MGIICCRTLPSSSISEVSKAETSIIQNIKSKQTIINEWEKNANAGESFELSNPWRSASANEDITKVYVIEKKLGQGYVGVVKKATLRSDPSKVFAIKSLHKKRLTKSNWNYVKREMDIFRETDCTYIVQFFECYQDDHYLHFVMEMCEGGDLVTLVERRNGLSEELAKRFFWQAATAVNYLHFFGIAHRDIKLDNFLLTNNYVEDSDLKLIDFGFAVPFRGHKLNSTVGTPFYVAPEVLAKNYSKECDVWSLGVLLYMMVMAEPPFKGKTNQEIFDQIQGKVLRFDGPRWAKLSPDLPKLLSGLLTRDPKKRLTIREALQSPWMQSTFVDYQKRWLPYLTPDILNSMRRITRMSPFQAEVMKLIVKIFHDYDDMIIRAKVFCLIDFFSNGVIEKQELQQIFIEHGMKVTEEETEAIIQRTFVRVEGVITYTEFLAATLDKKYFTKDEYIKPAFERIDIDQSGTITLDNIQGCFERFGYMLDYNTLHSFMNEFDSAKDGYISYSEFKAALAMPHDGACAHRRGVADLQC